MSRGINKLKKKQINDELKKSIEVTNAIELLKREGENMSPEVLTPYMGFMQKFDGLTMELLKDVMQLFVKHVN